MEVLKVWIACGLNRALYFNIMRYYLNIIKLNQWVDVCGSHLQTLHVSTIEESKPEKQDVAFNRLPSLVKQWDK